MSHSGLRLSFLGTGTSVGVPVLTCDCRVCMSADPRNTRLRSSALLEWELAAGGEPADAEGGEGRVKVLIDTSTDFRQQALRAGIDRVDAVVYTHHHADHVLGLDDLRLYNFRQGGAIPVYGSDETLAGIRRTFAYAFERRTLGIPRVDLRPVDGPFEILGRSFVPVPVRHGKLTILAYRIAGLGYITDCSQIPPESSDLLRDLDVLVIDALRREPHPTHFSLDEALAEIERLHPKKAILTHLSHDFDHAALQQEVGEGIDIAYDGLTIDIGAAGEKG